MPHDVAVLGQDPRFGGGALAQTVAFLTATTELGREAEFLYVPHPGLARYKHTLTWRRVEALRQLGASHQLVEEARDARSCWVVATVAHHGGAAPRSRRPYGCWLGTTIASEWHGRALGLPRLRRIAAGVSMPSLRAMEQRVVEQATHVYATSPASAAQIASAAHCSEADIRILPIPVDLEYFVPEADDAWRERATTEPVIGFVGRANDPRKNIGLLLQAFALVREELPSARLQLIGEPAVQAGGTGVEVTGVVDDVAGFVRRCTLLVLPSFQEGFGIVVAEALASGVPAVVTPCDGPEEIVRASGAGRVASGWTPRDLADSLLDLLAEPDALDRARQSARGYVEAMHSPERFRIMLGEAFEELDG